MTMLRGLFFFLTVLMIISNVNGRWLETSDGVHDINDMNQKNDSFLRMSVSDSNPTTLYASEKRCKSIYGFLPCADTMPESIFLIVMYTYALMLGEECLKKGSAALLIHFRKKDIAGSVFRVLMALPRVVMVIVSGALSTQSNAQNQVAFGFAMYAGSTVISLTGLWGVYVILNKEKLTKPSNSSSSRLSHFKDDGVKIDDDTCKMASIMLLSLIPFAIVLLLLVFSARIIVLLALIVSVLSFCSYIGYQIKNPHIQAKSVAYLKEEEFQQKFLLKLEGLNKKSIYTNEGYPDIEVIRSIFNERDADHDGKLKLSELKNFLEETFNDEDEHICREYALKEILRHFDKDNTQSLTMIEFEEGCTSWLNKWSVANKGLGHLQKFAADKKIDELAVIPKYLYEPLIKSLTSKENGVITEELEKLFEHDVNKDDKMDYAELKTAIVKLNIANQDPGAFAQSMIATMDKDNSGTLSKEEVKAGLKKLTEMANTPASGHNDLLTLFKSYVCEMLGLVNDKKGFDWNMLYILLGAGTLYLFAGPFMQSVIQFSNALQIPFLFTSFVVAPFFMNARSMVIHAFSFSSKNNSNRSGSLKFFELYSGLVMNNLMGLITLLAVVYAKDLTWSYTPEVVTIIAIGLIMGTFARSCKTYPLWTSILSFFLYITTIVIFCVYAWERP